MACIHQGPITRKDWRTAARCGSLLFPAWLALTPSFAQAPLNDDPCGAVVLPAASACTWVQGNTEDGTETLGIELPTCGLPVQNDVWYSIVVPPNGELLITTQPDLMNDAALALYQTTGGCDAADLSLVLPVSCQANGSPYGSDMPQQLFSNLAPGSTVYPRLWRESGPAGSFGICARTTINEPITGCDFEYADSGGALVNYGNSEVFEQTFCPLNAGEGVALSFIAFNTQPTTDFLTVYNGATSADPVLAVFSGSLLPPGFVAGNPSGCLTIRFTSDASITSSGWRINVSCGPLLPPMGTGGTIIYDSGGAGGDYSNSELVTQTLCPCAPGELVTLHFLSFSTEANQDFLTIFSGPSMASPSLGTFTGNTNPGTFTGSWSNGGCLTLRFTSDEAGVAAGWIATVRCGPPQPPPLPMPPGCCTELRFDPGGPNGNYLNGINQDPDDFGGNNCWPYSCTGGGATFPPGQPLWSQTCCPQTPGEAVTLSFLSFAVQPGADMVYIYDGPVVSPNNANGTQFMSSEGWPTCASGPGMCNQELGPGGFSGSSAPGPFTSTHPTGCLTVAMSSDDSVTAEGWVASINCGFVGNLSNECDFALRLYDDIGDGWMGSSITISVAGGPPNTFTIPSGSYSEVLFSAGNGDAISISYDGLGYFAADNFWTLSRYGTGELVFASAVPAVGGQQTFIADCLGPMQVQSQSSIMPMLTYPNPASDVLVLNLSGAVGTRQPWRIVDGSGRVVLRGIADVAPGSASSVVPVASLASGVYQIIVHGGVQGEMHGRFVKP